MRREYWHLTEGLIFAHFALFMVTYGSPEGREALALIPQLVRLRPWTVVTFQFVHGGMFWFFISMIVLWIMARPLEEAWGSPRFLVFWLVSILGAAGTALLLGQPLAGDVFLSTSLLFTFATLFPQTEFLLFFVLPVKVKWLAIVGGGFLIVSSLALGVLAGIANVVGMSAGYVFFLATRRLPTRRKLAFELKKKKVEVETAVENASVGRKNADWDARVRAAETRAREAGRVVDDDLPLLAELDEARDPSITVCAPEDFGYVDDPVCSSCPGFAECAARRIRLAAGEDAPSDES
jgi:membrane associated rhomboid family serine protease